MTGQAESNDAERIRFLSEENLEVGFFFASKAIVQIIASPFVGHLTSRIGYNVPMFTGFAITFVSTVMFAFSSIYALLIVARAIQGIGSACSTVAGMGMLADRYPDEKERGTAMGIALGGIALGVLVGPLFGGVMYQYVGKAAPFLILAGLALIDGALQLLVLRSRFSRKQQPEHSIFALLKDPYILVAVGAILFVSMGIATLEPTLPLWMMATMHSSLTEQGAVFLSVSASFLISACLFGKISHSIGRWLCCMVGMLITSGCMIALPFSTNVYILIVPLFGIGVAIGMVNSTMMPTMGYLVDIRHTADYGNIYAIFDMAFCLGFAVGPSLSGLIVKFIGFPWMLRIIAIICFVYSPLLYFLRNPPPQEQENMALIMQDNDSTPLKYDTYRVNEIGDACDDDIRSSSSPLPGQRATNNSTPTSLAYQG